MKNRRRKSAGAAPLPRTDRADTARSLNVQQLFDQGLLQAKAGDLESAMAAFSQVVDLRPDLYQAHFNLGLALIRLSRNEEALAPLRRVLALQSDHVWAIAALAMLYDRRGEWAESIRLYERLVRLDPQNPNTMSDLSLALYKAGRYAAAEKITRQALTAAPDRARLHHHLGLLVRKLQGDTAAIPHYSRALELDPDYALAWASLGEAYRRTSPDEAERCYREALARAPDEPSILIGVLEIELRSCDFDAVEETHARVLSALERDAHQITSWQLAANLLYESLFAPIPIAAMRSLQDHIALALDREARQGPLSETPAARPAGDRRLRVGYLSPNFRDHPVGHVTLSLFSAHDRQRFEIHAFSPRSGGPDGSEYARRHRTGFDAFHEIGGKSSTEAAAYIRSLGIDILVDLDGYMGNRSPPILALRPAPLQVFWLGHAGGLGLPFVDYLIADARVLPPGEEGNYREAIERMPDSYHCAHRHPIADTCPPRKAWNLPENAMVYCVFNNPDKIDHRVFDCWMRILTAVDGSVLWLSSLNQNREKLMTNLRRYAERQGVAPSRLILSERVPAKAMHLARFAHADLILDTLTLNASTTALDGLWAGVPLLAVRGERFSNRISTSMLHAIGLDDLVCSDLDEYERRAIQLGQDPVARSELRRRLQENREITPLFNIARFARNLEKAFEAMWERHRRGEPAISFDLPPVATD